MSIRAGVRHGMTCYRIAVAVAALATIGLALWNPRAARGDDGIRVLQSADRVMRSLDPTPDAHVPGSPEPDVWVVSTRRLPATCSIPTAPNLDVQRFEDDVCEERCGRGRWVPADLASLLEGDKPLVFFIHGNRYEAWEAKQQGLLLARHCAAICPDAGPVRTVIFSWPSVQQGILGKDGRAKFERAQSDGHYMAWLLGQVAPDRPVGVVGYSFGALITLEALDNLVAAEEAGRSDLQPWRHRPAQTNLMFIAAAVRCDAFAPCGPYRRTLDCVDRVSLIINSRDNALRFFPVVDQSSRMEALGHTGMPRCWMPEHVEFKAVNAESIIGKKHGLPLYLASPSLTKRLCSSAMCDLE